MSGSGVIKLGKERLGMLKLTVGGGFLTVGLKNY